MKLPILSDLHVEFAHFYTDLATTEAIDVGLLPVTSTRARRAFAVALQSPPVT